MTASVDHKARVWDAASGKSVQPLSWHFATVNDAEFSPDGRWIVTAGRSSAADLVESRCEPAALPVRDRRPGPKTLTTAVFDPTSRTVLAASKDGTVRTYHCALCGGLDDLLEIARARLALTGRKLTVDERKQYGG